MKNPLPLVSIDEVAPGQSVEVVAGGRIFAVYNVEGAIHVIDGICPHAGGPLGKGMLSGCIVTCPWHGWQFDVTNGQHCLNETIRQLSYEVSMADKMICISLGD